MSKEFFALPLEEQQKLADIVRGRTNIRAVMARLDVATNGLKEIQRNYNELIPS